LQQLLLGLCLFMLLQGQGSAVLSYEGVHRLCYPITGALVQYLPARLGTATKIAPRLHEPSLDWQLHLQLPHTQS